MSNLEVPIMDDIKGIRDDSSECASPSFQDRILDRKIERRALTESFSSNLGRKGHSSNGNMSGRSVQAMVSLFEKSGGKPESPTSRRARAPVDRDTIAHNGDGKAVGDSNDEIQKATSSPQQPKAQQDQPDPIPTTPFAFHRAQVGYQVEEYSLTLLKHKCYFNNRPLARCLDDYQEKEDDKKTQQVLVQVENGKKPATDHKENARTKSQGKENMDTLAPKRIVTPAPIQRLDDLMSDLSIWPEIAGSKTPKPRPKKESRDPAEVEGYWSNVRANLWIDEDEVDLKGYRPIRMEQNEVMSPYGDEVLDCHYPADPDPDPDPPPPPMPSRPPPPVPKAPQALAPTGSRSRQTQHSAAPSVELFPDPDGDYPAWDQPPPTPSVRLSISAPGFLNITKLLPDMYPNPEPPISQPRPAEDELRLSAQTADNSHSRHPSSGSAPWVRPPTWRSPSLDRTYALPPLPPIPMPTTQNHHHHRHHRSRHQHPTHNHEPSRTSTSTSISAYSAITADSDRSIHNRRTPKTSTSSATTHSTRAASSTDLSTPRVEGALRRLTTEEKLSEIDAFLSLAEESNGGRGD